MSPNQLQVGGDHYRAMKIQPERFIYENGIGYHEGNAIKYLCRWRRKAGVQDLQKAKHYIDLLIAHQDVGQEKDEAPQPAPALPRLNTGWKWAVKGEHTTTQFDKFWRSSDGILRELQPYDVGVDKWDKDCAIITPDWHNPEGIESPGEGWRFLVKGEGNSNDDQVWCNDKRWRCIKEQKPRSAWTYRTPATRPLPPVLADEKEVQS